MRETHQAIKDWTIANGIDDIDFREKIKNVVEHRLNGENGEKATNGENNGNGENPSKDSD